MHELEISSSDSALRDKLTNILAEIDLFDKASQQAHRPAILLARGSTDPTNPVEIPGLKQLRDAIRIGPYLFRDSFGGIENETNQISSY